MKKYINLRHVKGCLNCVLKEAQLNRSRSKRSFLGRHTSTCLATELGQQPDTAENFWSLGISGMNAECFLGVSREEAREKGKN